MSDWLAGRNPVTEALKAGRPLEKVLIAEGVKSARIAHLTKLAREQGVVTQRVKRQKLDQLTGGAVHQGIVAIGAPHRYSELQEVLTAAEKKSESPFLIVLDQLKDPHNLGSILRTADAAGADGVIIPKRRAAGLTGTVAKTAAGAVEYVPVVRVTNLSRTLQTLKAHGFWITGAEATADKLYTEVDYTISTALVFGSEGKGISRLVRENCDYLVHLPMRGEVNSLNVSVAAGLLMYEVLRQRNL